MAFGNVIQAYQSGSFASFGSLPVAPQAGNSILVFTDSDADDVSVSDNLNGPYTKVRAGGAGTVYASMFFVVITDAASNPTITITNPGTRFFAAEAEGQLSDAVVGGTSAGSAVAGTGVAFSTTTGNIPANSASYGYVLVKKLAGAATFTAPWVDMPTLEFLSYRQDTGEALGANLSGTYSGQNSDDGYAAVWASFAQVSTSPTLRKGSTITVDKPGTLGTVTTATLNGVNVFDHLTAQDATTATFAGAATDEITTSGEYSLVLGDGAVTETVAIQVSVYGVTPSNNPLQKDGAALASLTGVQLRVTSGADINGTEMYYSGAATTDASGNLGIIDVSSTAAADADPVLLHLRTAAGDSIIAAETVGLI